MFRSSILPADARPAIGLESDYFNGLRQVRSRPDGRLKTFAVETSGGYFELKDTDDLGPTFTRVVQDGKLHELEVRVRERGMTARARKTYIAPTAP